ncbi:xylulokinase [Ornithinimicrobium kibberense]|uniref:Xylulose kinase n=1 Tax=Ornithinimicrobium kibberense TaxID=282060 RepID=A0ABV5V649_9MICO|nr:FGGY family carbohydrate kinase [Ornithinimicrobium kibberense]
MDTPTLVAGIDSSTQSCKVMVCDARTGEVVRTGRAPHPDGTEVHPDHWWGALQETTSGGLLEGVSAISVAGQQHGMVCLDEDQQVVRPALLWNDTRSAPDALDLIDELGGPQAWAEAIGVVPVAAITVSKLRWLARNEPDHLARTRTCVLPHDWLTSRLLAGDGRVERWVTDRSDASGTGYFSASTNSYHLDLLRLATGRDDLELPEVLGPATAAGRTPGGRVVGPGAGDNAAAALGLGLVGGDVAVSLGTSGTAFASHSRPTQDPTGEVAGFADAAGGHLPLMCTLNAARVLGAGAQALGTDLAGLERLALGAEPGAGGLTLLPYLDGERTPNLPTASGTLSGMTRDNLTPANVARAFVEGMLLNVAAGVDALRREGVDVRRVLLIGGATGSAAVREIAATFIGVPLVVPAPGEYVARGAARQAAWVLSGEDACPAWAAVEHVVSAEPVVDPVVEEIKGRYAELLSTVHGVRQ